ncbi:hypothetical protein [Rhodopirellula bahusiensis]|uniref:hypothetical protein n=1 Tax=Rhodopirellula bahusiensis TaxID=2014065 RepID=UPI003266652C
MAKKAAKRRPRSTTPAKKRPAKKTAKKPVDRVERALAAALKSHRGSKLTQTESRDLAWHQKQQHERIAREAYEAVPKGVFCAMAGRQQRTVDDQAEKYGLDVEGPDVDLFLFIKSAFDLISANAGSIRPNHVSFDIEEGDDVGALEYKLKLSKLQEEVTKLQQTNERLGIQIKHERGDTINRQDLRALLGWFSTRVEGFGQQLRRTSGGEEAQTTLNEFLEQLAAECREGVLQV